MNNNNEIVKRIKEEDKKSIGKYIIIMIGCGLFGGVVGGMSALLKDTASTRSFAEMLNYILIGGAPYIILISTIISISVSTVLYRKSRKQYAVCDEDDEAAYSQIECRLDMALVANSVNCIIFLIFMAVGFASVNMPEGTFDSSGIRVVVSVAGYFLALISMLVIQQKIINFSKEMNPEKKGSIYDRKFMEKWEESCDEAEKLVTYKCAYASYKRVCFTCMVLWLFCLVGIFVWNFDLVSVFVVGIIWLVSILSYGIKAMELTKDSIDK